MARSTRSTDRAALKKGQQALAFFLSVATLTTMADIPAASAHEVSASVNHKSSAGLFYEDQWLRKGLRAQHRNVVSSLDASVGATAHLTWGDLRIAKQYKGYYQGASNVLFLAAMSEHGNKLQVPNHDGFYSLNADLHVLDATQVSFAKHLQWGQQKLTLRPHLFSIHEYQGFKTRGGLQVQGSDARINGGVFERVGTRQYGFLRNDKADSGWGWGLDLEGHFQHGLWQLDVQVNNLFNQLRFSTVHYSRDLYNVHAVDGEIQISGNSSMTGDYGHKRSIEHLPVQTWSALGHASLPWLQGGVYSVGADAVPWLGVQWQRGAWNVQATTIQGRNLSVAATWQAPAGMTLGAGITHAGGATRIGQLQAAWRW